jgi:hypothetical protein
MPPTPARCPSTARRYPISAVSPGGGRADHASRKVASTTRRGDKSAVSATVRWRSQAASTTSGVRAEENP